MSNSDAADDAPEGDRAAIAPWKRAVALLYVLVSNGLLLYAMGTAISRWELGSPLTWSLSEWAAAAVWLGPTVVLALAFTVVVPYIWWRNAHRRSARRSELRATQDHGETSGERAVIEYETEDGETSESEVRESVEVESD